MKQQKIEKGQKAEILPPNSKRKAFAIRVLKFGATVELDIDGQLYNIPGNEGYYQIESAKPWKGTIKARCEDELDIQVIEVE